MKKTLVFICIVTMSAFLSSAWAVDRNPKSKEEEKKKETTEIKEMTKEKAKQKSRSAALSGKTIRGAEEKQKAAADKLEPSEKQQNRQKTSERYDYFMDANDNGVDDRLEKKTKPAGEKQQAEKRPIQQEKKSAAKVAPATPKPTEAKPEKSKEPTAKEAKKETKPKKIDDEKAKDNR